MLTISCCLVLGLGFRLGVHEVSVRENFVQQLKKTLKFLIFEF